MVSKKTVIPASLEVVLDNEKIKQISARVEGSALAKACASIMCDELMDRSLEEANSLKNNIFTWLDDGIPPDSWSGDLIVYQSLSRFPERLDCAKLCWNGLGAIPNN